MTTSKKGSPSGISPSSKPSRFPKLEEAHKKLSCSPAAKNDRTVFNALATIQFGTIELIIPQDRQDAPKPIIATATTATTPIDVTPSAIPSCVTSPVLLSSFPQNVAAPSLHVALPPPGTRLATTAQLAHCNQLLRTHLSPSSATASITGGQDQSQRASVDALLHNVEEQQKICELVTRVVEEFVMDGLKTVEEIAEVVLLGPTLAQGYYRKLLNCFIEEFEAAKLFDIDLLQGLVRLVQCAGPDYLQPDDLVRMLVVLRTRLQVTHQQTAKHSYYLTLALSRLLDVMVEGKVQDLSRVVDHEPLSALLGQLMESSDPYLKHQACYAHQGLLHVPNDETRRQFVLRHAGNIAMGLLGVASVCKLDLNGVLDGAGKLQDATVSALEIGIKVVGGSQSLYESGQGIAASARGGIFSGGRLLWYTALREAREHIQNGRLSDFKHLIFEAPCSGDLEFQWGVCQLLGEIAVDLQWEGSTRQHAAELLAELYKNDTICNSNKELDSWILQIIRQVVASPDAAISSHAQLLLQGLDKKGDISKQALYRDVMDGPLSPYPLRTYSPVLSSSPLLARVQGVPDVEYDLHRFRMQRLKEPENALYVPPQAKPTLQSSDDTLFPLMEKTLEFLKGSGQVFLLLGDSGGGKSTFNLQLEHTLWEDYKRGGAIPLHINLPAIDNPQQDMITKQLQQLHLFSEAQIQELRQSRQFIVICDGYDESQLKKNIYASNFLNQPGQWKAKLVISCRSQYLGSDYRSRFQPTGDRYQQPTVELFQEAVIASFSRSQIEQYVEQFVQKAPSYPADTIQSSWTVADYMDKLNKIPKLIELVANPFLLTMALRALPKISRFEQDLSTIRLTRVGLYDNFVEEWLEINKLRLEGSILSAQAQEILDILSDEGFVEVGITFQKDLAAAIFQHQNGAPLVEYSHIRESRTWKASFFGPDAQGTLLRESSPLTRSGNKYRFLHRSILEYLYSRVISDPFESPQLSVNIGSDSGTIEYVESFVIHPLNQRSIVNEPSILQFLAERTELDPVFKSRLLAAVKESKADARVSQAAANAISILVRAGVRFNSADLRGIRIPGADICGGQFDSADLQGADLSGVNLAKTWLRQANLSDTNMTGVQFGELPYLEIGEVVMRCVFSPNGAFLAVSTGGFMIIFFETATWTKVLRHRGGYAFAISPMIPELANRRNHDTEICGIFTGKVRLVLSGHSDFVNHISYSPDGEMIATCSDDDTIRIWSTSSGDTLHVLHGHTGSVRGVAFSPTGLELVSCSDDKTVRTWDTQTGEPLLILEGHDLRIRSVAFSPDGLQIASGDEYEGLALWDTHTGVFIRALAGHTDTVTGVVYSPDGHQLASCSRDGDIRLWDPLNGELFGTLSGHSNTVTCVSYSPSGKHIASGSLDGTVRLWDAGRALSREEPNDNWDGLQCFDMSPDGAWTAAGNRVGAVQIWETRTGKPVAILTGHKGHVNGVAFSPCGKRVASAGWDRSVRLWCARTGKSVNVFQGHTGGLLSIAFSPSGHQLASGGGPGDPTVRLWDTKTGEPGLILEGHTDRINGLVFSPSGHQIASCSGDTTVRLWSPLTGEQLVILHHEEALDRVVFSPDRLEVISVSWFDNGLCCWNTQSGEKIDQPTLKGHIIISLSYSPCGKLLATGDREGVLHLWGRNLEGSDWSEVYRSSVGMFSDIRWIQGLDGMMYLTTLNVGNVRMWEVMEVGSPYTLRLLWSLGENELSLADADLSGAVGLRPVDIKLVKQRGAVTESTIDNE